MKSEIFIQRKELGGIGAPVVNVDFGGMGNMGFDLDAWATDLWKKTVASAQTSATNAVVSSTQKFIVNLINPDGTKTTKTMTQAEIDKMKQDQSLNFQVPSQTIFTPQVQQMLLIGGVAASLLLLGVIVFKAFKK